MTSSIHTKRSAVPALAIAATTWMAILYQSPAVAVAGDAVDQPSAADRSIQINTMREPVVVPLALPEPERLFGGKADALNGLVTDAAEHIRVAAAANPSRLITLQPKASLLAFRTLSQPVQTDLLKRLGDDAPAAYEEAVAAFIGDVLKEADPGRSIALTIAGLPVEGPDSGGFAAPATNDRYASVIDRLDAFTSNRSFLMQNSAANEPSYVYLNLSEAIRLHAGRSIIFRTNNLWRIATFVTVSPQRMASAGESFLPLADDVESKGGDSDWYDHDEVEPQTKLVTSESEKRDGGGGGTNALGSDGAKRKGSSGGSGKGGSGGSGGGGGSGGLSSGGGGGSGGSARGAGSSSGGSGASTDGDNSGGGSNWIPDGEADAGGVTPHFGSPNPLDFGPSDGGGGGNNGSFPILSPGSGFNGPTGQPVPVGSPWMAGYDAKAIARWDVVPYQDFTGEFHIGVVAFHMNGIHRVDFSANGGPWVSAHQMLRNPRTDVWEYTAVLRASDFSDGPVEVRAIVWPEGAGVPRVLAGPIHQLGVTNGYPRNGEHSIFLHANSAGTLASLVCYVDPVSGSDTAGDGSLEAPFKSIHAGAKWLEVEQGGNAGGGIIYLLAGNHPWVGWTAFGQSGNVPAITTRDRWLTITRAPGTSKSAVTIKGDVDSQGLKTHLVRIAGITVLNGITTPALNSSSENPTLWFDDCYITLNSPTTTESIAGCTSWVGGILATDTEIVQVRNAVVGWSFNRNVICDQIGADAFREQRFVVNCEVRNIGGYGLAEHEDVIQWYIPSTDIWDNTIVYGFTAVKNVRAQPWFARIYNDQATFDNAAFVNVLLASKTHAGQWQCPGNHILFWHFNIVRPPDATGSLAGRLMVRDDSGGHNVNIMRNLDIRNSVFNELTWTATSPTADQVPSYNSHFVTGATYGSVFTTGSPQFINPWSYDYRPSSSSPLTGRVTDPMVPADVAQFVLQNPAAIGAAQP